ncbi:glycosyltransferase [Methylobacterium sp. NEAU 140]|uniref:glycosyltransferase n=1 Tax=Methylobacterium sp. NEAU 140 TaxID=3064945 RepID=UPI0027357E62|nr:glycosyltransferase [Methylobacterium sp. NEAU 140]MDP4023744.1 glycosyltransferase [Methylobacterium sp. NEAU 140]
MSERDAHEPRPRVAGAVVIGRNEGERLRACLAALDPSTLRVVYVDSGSTDGSVAHAARAGMRVVQLDMTAPFTAARARNAGFDALRRIDPAVEWVQFLDGDCELNTGWLLAATAFLESHPSAALVCGRRRERFPERTPFNRLCDLEWNAPVGEITECGGDFLVRADAFAQVGGFNPGLIAGEEPELCVRLRAQGWRLWRIPREMTLHDADMRSLRQWWLRTVRSGHAFAQVSLLHRGSAYRIWGGTVPRAVIWCGILPASLLAGVAIDPWMMLALVVYPVQIARIAARRDIRSKASWLYAYFALAGKLPEAVGMARFYLRAMLGRSQVLIEYK